MILARFKYQLLTRSGKYVVLAKIIFVSLRWKTVFVI